MKKWAFGLLVALLAIAATWWWLHRSAPTPTPPPAVAPIEAPQPVASAPASAPVASPVAAEPVIAHPVPAAASGPALPTLKNADATVMHLLTELLGSKAVQGFLQNGNFIHRCVATLDNLGRDHAPSMLWPVYPTPGHFTELVAEKAGSKVDATEIISPDNALRYRPLVQFISSIDAVKAARLYFSVYPLFQQAYEELGFPHKYFNDRLVQVLDLLIATPQPNGPVAVHQIVIQGSVKSTHPMYEFADPAWEQLSAGQKIMLRIGQENADLLRRKLQAFRAAVSAPRAPP